MEKKLTRLFDYQKFQGNARLAAIIGDVESRYARALSDDELELVNAAGDADGLLLDVVDWDPTTEREIPVVYDVEE